MKKNRLNKYLLLYSGIIIYSFSSVMSKVAASYTIASWKFFFFYGLALFFSGGLCAFLAANFEMLFLDYGIFKSSTGYNFGDDMGMDVFW